MKSSRESQRSGLYRFENGAFTRQGGGTFGSEARNRSALGCPGVCPRTETETHHLFSRAVLLFGFRFVRVYGCNRDAVAPDHGSLSAAKTCEPPYETIKASAKTATDIQYDLACTSHPPLRTRYYYGYRRQRRPFPDQGRTPYPLRPLFDLKRDKHLACHQGGDAGQEKRKSVVVPPI